MARVSVSNRPKVTRYFNYTSAAPRVEVTTSLDTLVITNDLDIQVLYQRNGSSDVGVLMARLSGSGQPATYGFYFAITGASSQLNYRWAPTGVASGGIVSKTSTANLAPITVGNPVWLRVTHDVDNGAAGNDVRFYWGAYKGNLTPPSAWTQIGATQTTAGVTAIFHTPTVGVTLGSFWSGSSGILTGKVYRGILKNGIDGPALLDFDATNNTFNSFFFTEGQGRSGVVTGGVAVTKSRPVATGRVSAP